MDLLDRLLQQATERPTASAVRGDRLSLTYRELAGAVGGIAEWVRELPGAPGGRVAFMLANDAPYVAATYGVFAANRVAVGLKPIDPRARHVAVLADAEPDVIVTDEAHLATAEEVAGDIPVVLLPDPVPSSIDGMRGARDPDELAVLLYTSGSTGEPKGVMHTHGSLDHQAKQAVTHGRRLPTDRIAFFQPVATTPGLFAVGPTIRVGAESHPYDLEARGVAGIPAFLRDRAITVFSASTSIIRSVVRSLSPDERFDGVRLVRFTAEGATGADLEAVRLRFGPEVVVHHSLGSSETGGMSMHIYEPGDPAPAGRLSVGTPYEGMRALLLDDNGNPVPPGELGEVVIEGPAVAAGYWRDPARTAARFSEVPGDRIRRRYRSGDLGRHERDGTLRIVGRADDQVKVRGHLVITGEIELALLAHPAVSMATLAARLLESGDTRLGAHVVLRPGASTDVDALRAHVAGLVPTPAVPTSFTIHDALPMAAAGKVDRRALAALDAERERAAPVEEDEAPGTGVEAAVLEAWRTAFERDDIGLDDDFFDLGGDSLTAAVIAARIEATCGVELDVATIPVARRLREMVDTVHEASRVARLRGPIVPVPRDPPPPASTTQQRIWRHHQAGSAYAMATVSRVLGPFDVEVLRRAVDAVQRRHELLRTTFEERDGVLVQVVHEDLPIPMSVVDGSAEDGLRLAEELAATPFDLGREAPMRVAVVRVGADDHVLVRVIHHIAADATANGILFVDLDTAYRGIALEPLRIQSADHGAWERATIGPGTVLRDEQVQWWRQHLAGLRPASPLRHLERPAPDPTATPYDGVASHDVETQLAVDTVELARRLGATPYAVDLAAFASVLHATGGDGNDLLLGAYVSLRRRAELLELIGDFTNMVPLRLPPPGELDGRRWVALVQREVLQVTSRADVAWEDVYGELDPDDRAAADIRCLFQQGTLATPRRLGDAMVETMSRGRVRMPWSMGVASKRRGRHQELFCTFDAHRFDPAAVHQLLADTEAALRRLVADPEAPVVQSASKR